jgi:hypothetical protein
MRRIAGSIILPADATEAIAREIAIELRDVTRLDAPSLLVAEHRLRDVRISPRLALLFELNAPESPASHDLNLRVHVDLRGAGSVQPGDFLTTMAVAVPTSGEVRDLRVPLARV